MEKSWGDHPLPFVAVGRLQDFVILAHYTAVEDAEKNRSTKEVFTKFLKAASKKLGKGQRTRLQWNEGSVCCMLDNRGKLLYCVVTSLLTYPEKLAHQLLCELNMSVLQLDGIEAATENSFDEELRPRMKELVSQYQDPKNFPQLSYGIERKTSLDVEENLNAPLNSTRSSTGRARRRSPLWSKKAAVAVAAALGCIVITFVAMR
mmetsp:Transcript_55849/g.86797  ORF Transcript_55849/g.86797 Transcript_55849/m.86797 type:complete len:205 (-) Transcript_55849:110-724(-)